MESTRISIALCRRCLIVSVVFLCLAISSGNAHAQVRTKKPDRGVYQPPTLEPMRKTDAAPLQEFLRTENDLGLREAPKRKTRPTKSVNATPAKWGAPLVDTEMTDARDAIKISPAQQSLRRVDATVQPRHHRKVSSASQLAPPHRPQQRARDVVMTGGETWTEPGVYHEGAPHDVVIDGAFDVSCDSGCDSIGSYHARSWLGYRNAFLSFAPDQWFGSAELMLMFRKGDILPPLVTTGSDADADTAGELGNTDTQVIVGNEALFKDMTAGGRFMLGTWLDCQQCRSLTFRGWFAGEKSFHFIADQDTNPVLARPILNVSDGQDPEQDTQLVTFPDRSTGSILINGDSNVYGADISIHQFCYGKYGGTVDFLYGYQYMGVEENLAIASTSTSLDEDFAPVGSVISVLDSFEIENQFHGAQLGLASAYREGCWSFRSLMKIGFGSLRRSSNLLGQTTTSIDGATATDANGLLVRSTNRGQRSDSTLAWSPEADFTLGWQRYPCFDLTFGYHIVALTDALELSGVIDPELAVNLSDPPTDAQRPSAAFRYGTYYVQGIHFGLQYIY